ncbi:disulfide bond formation protein B [Staphylococcus felis]|uniref:Disulfide bond formation protein B n=1 Tax=Staphylococcus felis TaxID=46127 RepID=A0A3E0IPH3_9STAP|nr:disulfide bond formation protein B [Staphylococcus felis]
MFKNYFIFIISVISLLSSLILQYILKIEPCNLCWYQRIFLFPIPFLSYININQNSELLKKCIKLFSIIGLTIAFIHLIIQTFNINLTSCSFETTNCSSSQYLFDFIPIPLLSILIFSIILISLTNFKKKC